MHSIYSWLLSILAFRGPLWLRLAVLAGYLYLGALLVLFFGQGLLLFPGATFANYRRGPNPALAAEDVLLHSASGETIHAWWCAPSGWKPCDGAILYSHGNGSNLSKRQGAIRRWRDATGMAVLAYDYPGYGRSSGRPNEANCYAAAEASLDWLAEKGVPAGRVLHVGESLGSAVAVEMAVRHGGRMVVLLCPFTSMPDMAQYRFPWLPGRYLVWAQFDSLAKVPSLKCPVFIAHGTEDTVVPARFGKRLYEAAPEPKRFLPMPGRGHCHPGHAEFFDAVKAFQAETR
jgi:fermentation-respiration switch protein FrsA (DUF1100 family)